MNEKVRELRKALGLTLEKFGERLGVGKAVLSQIENGKANLTDQMLKAICNVNWDGKYVNEKYLRGNSDKMFRNDLGNELDALAEKYHMSDIEYFFLKEFFKIDPSHREDFFKTLEKVFAAVRTKDVPETAPTSIEELDKLSGK